tara:strand:+ start:3840 stop:4328 length:489 start_codon:yes stop_codon:yes gene_type:complete
MLEKNLKIALDKYVPIVEQKIRERLEQQNLNATRSLSNSIKAKSFNAYDQAGIKVTALDYYDSVDKGTSPGRFPSINKIKEWAKAKGIVSLTAGMTINDNKWATIISAAIKKRGTIKRFNYQGAGISRFIIDSLEKKLLNDISRSYLLDIDTHLKKTNRNIK